MSELTSRTPRSDDPYWKRARAQSKARRLAEAIRANSYGLPYYRPICNYHPAATLADPCPCMLDTGRRTGMLEMTADQPKTNRPRRKFRRR